jgi:hypothetical protein
MRKIIRLLLALILGFVAFEVVDLWPVRPMWSKPFAKMAIVGFSEDEKHIFLMEGMSHYGPYHRGSAMSMLKYEVATATEKQRVELSIPSDFYELGISSSSDCAKVLFYGCKADPSQRERGDYVCYLFDAKTGQCIGGPWECGDERNVLLSSDARWICHPGLQLSNPSLTVISSENGRAVFSSAIAGTRFGNVYRFSPDGSKLAALTFEQSTLKLKIISVPSGEVLNSFEIPMLPDEPIVRVSDWSGNIISFKFSDEQRFESARIQSFRIEKDKLIPLKREPVLQIKNGDMDYYIGVTMKPTVVIHARTGKATWPEYEVRIAEWCDEHFGTRWSAKFNERTTYRFFDRQTGKFRLDIPVDSLINGNHGHTGKYFASYAGETPLLEVWNADPFPRWPWSAGAAMLTFLLIYFFPSLRRRSKTNGHVVQTPHLS